MMLLPDARAAIVTTCQELSRAGLVVGTAGNVSVREYAGRPEARAVVHTHSPAATALSALVDEVPAVHYYVAMFGGPTVPVAPYATYGTDELARNVVHALRDRTACLMGNHGAVTVGPDLTTAQDKSTYLEWLCDVYLRASSAGAPRLLPAAEIAAVGGKMAGYGQQPPSA
jgi:L-fuculose-phosphate aldolase